MNDDRLSIFSGKQSCPVCGSISPKGSSRCHECGTFHGGLHLEERTAPTPEERVAARQIDPSEYSMDPNSAIMDEQFDSDEGAVKSWSGGSTDFSFVDENKKIKQSENNIEIPESEEIYSD